MSATEALNNLIPGFSVHRIRRAWFPDAFVVGHSQVRKMAGRLALGETPIWSAPRWSASDEIPSAVAEPHRLRYGLC
ncbi:MAG: hypothetical protein WCA32_16030 [Chromatiaceae bacterium]